MENGEPTFAINGSLISSRNGDQSLDVNGTPICLVNGSPISSRIKYQPLDTNGDPNSC